MATLYIVGTPLGNLEDVSLRALRVFKEVEAIICEDTRVTGKLLARYNIEKKLISYPSDFEKESGVIHRKIGYILEILRDDKDLAMVSDAGTPGVSDPGAKLVERVRKELPDVRIECVPGPSAITAALSICGIYTTSFNFWGFPPNKKGRTKFFGQIAGQEMTSIFFESPHRIIKALISFSQSSASQRKITVCKELTKIHEEVISGTADELLSYFDNHPEKVAGEFVVIVGQNEQKGPASK